VRPVNTPNTEAAWLRTPLAELLGIRYPIVQGPLNGLNTQRLTAAVSNFGGLGSFGAHGLTPDALKAVIAELRSLTSKPFAINLWVSMEDASAFDVREADFDKSLAAMSANIRQMGGTLPAFAPYKPIRFADQMRVVLDANVPAFSFICGIPPREILDECRARGIRTIGTATTPAEAVALEQHGIEMIVASGFEAGGHRASFLRPAAESLIGTFSLLPQVVDAVKIPVIAAGGIADARGVLAALALGAQGVLMGTAFLASEQSGTNPLYRDLLRTGRAGSTALTKNFTGRLARGIENELMQFMNRPDVPVLPYPLQRQLLRNLTTPAEKRQQSEWLALWAGQSANLSRNPDPIDLLTRLIDQTAALAPSVSAWSRRVAARL
jgi:nitronate monooxygenase